MYIYLMVDRTEGKIVEVPKDLFLSLNFILYCQLIIRIATRYWGRLHGFLERTWTIKHFLCSRIEQFLNYNVLNIWNAYFVLDCLAH